MPKTFILTDLLLIFAFVLTGLSTAAAQVQTESDLFSEERRPFDFRDKFYYDNGVEPSMILQRRNGLDGLSVFDATTDPRFREVRLTAAFPAYNYDGKTVFYNAYGELYKEGFVAGPEGDRAAQAAFDYPIYEFPSALYPRSNRQAALVRADDGYFQKNPLGLGVVLLVEFTEQINSRKSRAVIDELAARNGISLDGTPIIRTLEELKTLAGKNLVTIREKGADGNGAAPFALARVIRDPTRGAVTPDAFLLMVLKKTGEPLEAEDYLLSEFGCLRKSGSFCPQVD
jgi:hypothetical protein